MLWHGKQMYRRLSDGAVVLSAGLPGAAVAAPVAAAPTAGSCSMAVGPSARWRS